MLERLFHQAKLKRTRGVELCVGEHSMLLGPFDISQVIFGVGFDQPWQAERDRQTGERENLC